MSINVAGKPLQEPAHHVTDSVCRTPSIRRLYFLGKGGAVTVAGIFVDQTHKRVGVSFTTVIPAADGATQGVQIAASIPDKAVGAIVTLSLGGGATALYYDIAGTEGAEADTDFETNYANYPIIFPNPEANAIARARTL